MEHWTSQAVGGRLWGFGGEGGVGAGAGFSPQAGGGVLWEARRGGEGSDGGGISSPHPSPFEGVTVPQHPEEERVTKELLRTS